MASGVLSCDGQPQQLLHQTPYGPCEMPDVIYNVKDTFHQQTSAFPNQFFFFSKPAALPSQCSWCPDVKHGQVHLLSDSRSPFSGQGLFLFCKIWLESKLQFHYMGFCCAILHCHWRLDTLSRLLTVIITWCSTTQLGSRSRSCLKVRQSSQSTV